MTCGNLGNKEFIKWSFSLLHKYSDEINIVLLSVEHLSFTIHIISFVEDEILKTAMPI
jgi:hypothetical protein